MTNNNSLPKLVASDIGGTLIKSTNLLPEFTARVLNRLIADNIPVALVTGYNHDTTLRYCRNLDERAYLMPQNGTICLKEDREIWEQGIPENDAREIYRFLDDHKVPIIVYKGQNHGFRNYFVGVPDFRLPDAFQQIEALDDFTGITGISTRVSNQIIPTLKPQLEQMINDKFQLAYSRQETISWLEILQPDVRKDLAIKRLCNELDIPVEKVIFFGDNFNDQDALRMVGHPVVVGNAMPELKQSVPTVIRPVTEEGVAHYLNELYQLNMVP